MKPQFKVRVKREIIDGKLVYFCVKCDRPFSSLSKNGLCMPCALGNMQLEILQLKNKEGLFYDKWLSAYQKGFKKREDRRKIKKLTSFVE